MPTDDDSSTKNPKLAAELALILRTFRLEGEKIIRLSDGTEAKGTLSGSGYFYVRAGSKKDGTSRLLKRHRVKYGLGKCELSELIDHRDGDRTNDTIENLRPCTPSQNAANARHPNRPLSKTGHRGVYEMANGKYLWRVGIGGKRYQRQPFDTADEAKEDREAFKKAMTGEHYHRSYMVRIKLRGNSKGRNSTKPRHRK